MHYHIEKIEKLASHNFHEMNNFILGMTNRTLYEEFDEEDGDALIFLLLLKLLFDFLSLRFLLLLFESLPLCRWCPEEVPGAPANPNADGNAATNSGWANGDIPDACKRVK